MTCFMYALTCLGWSDEGSNIRLKQPVFGHIGLALPTSLDGVQHLAERVYGSIEGVVMNQDPFFVYQPTAGQEDILFCDFAWFFVFYGVLQAGVSFLSDYITIGSASWTHALDTVVSTYALLCLGFVVAFENFEDTPLLHAAWGAALGLSALTSYFSRRSRGGASPSPERFCLWQGLYHCATPVVMTLIGLYTVSEELNPGFPKARDYYPNQVTAMGVPMGLFLVWSWTSASQKVAAAGGKVAGLGRSVLRKLKIA